MQKYFYFLSSHTKQNKQIFNYLSKIKPWHLFHNFRAYLYWRWVGNSFNGQNSNFQKLLQILTNVGIVAAGFFANVENPNNLNSCMVSCLYTAKYWHFSSKTNLFSTNILLLYPWKYQKIIDFLIFSGGIDVEHWLKMG